MCYKERELANFMSVRTWQEIEHRLDILCTTDGGLLVNQIDQKTIEEVQLL